MKIFLSILLAIVATNALYASKLSRYLDKVESESRVKEQQEIQQDMNFSDYAFRLDRRYVDERGDKCRDYVARSRSNPYRKGYYTVCDER